MWRPLSARPARSQCARTFHAVRAVGPARRALCTHAKIAAAGEQNKIRASRPGPEVPARRTPRDRPSIPSNAHSQNKSNVSVLRVCEHCCSNLLMISGALKHSKRQHLVGVPRAPARTSRAEQVFDVRRDAALRVPLAVLLLRALKGTQPEVIRAI